MRIARTVAVVAGLVAGVAGMAGCSASPHIPQVIHVSPSTGTIQEAVDSARPGDLVLIAPGTYREEVRVTTADITIRGEDRNTVILDGEDRLHNGIAVVADGVSVENLTVHSFTVNGVLVTGTGEAGDHDGASSAYDDPAGASIDPETLHFVERFHVSYVTAYNNGLYGVYAFQARDGVLDNIYASGHPDSGIYVGQCTKCNTVVDSVVLENNAIGYFGTNASDNVYLVRSIMRGNRLGATPNSQDQELLAPQVKTYVVGNLVVDNDNPETPPIEAGFFGGGIGVGGGFSNYIARNYVAGNEVFGIGVVALNPYDPTGNEIVDNVLVDNGLDLLFAPTATVTSSLENCFAGNTFTTSIPEAIEAAMPCDAGDVPLAGVAVRYPVAPPGVDYRDMAAPGPQTTMPGDVNALPVALPATPAFPELASIPVPTP